MFDRQTSAVFLFILFLIANIFTAQAATLSPEAVNNRKQALEAELAKVEKEIETQNKLLRAKQAESASLERDIEILNYQISRAKLNIKAKQIEIERLGGDIVKKERLIGSLEDKIESEKDSLAELLRKRRETETVSLAEAALADESFSRFLTRVDQLEFVEESIHQAFEEMRSDKQDTEREKTALEKRKRAELDAQKVIEAERQVIAKKEAEKKTLLGVSKSHEKTYAEVLKIREKRAAEIRSALFALRDTAAIPFGTALKYANQAFNKTGVRPAFLLAILTQESNLGENIGTCNRPGDPAGKRWQAIMPGPNDKSSRNDEAAYLRITSKLGLDPNSMPLSCPWQGGWGGAMGPAQFIPTTWEGMAGKVATALGKQVANPWEPEDAFMASALFLRELGAARGGFSSEREAALRYYAGGNWQAAKNAFYGNEVMVKARDIQLNMVNVLQNG